MTPEPQTIPPGPTWTLSRIAGAFRRLWVVVVAAALLGAGTALALSENETPTFESTSTLAFSLSQGTTAADLANGSTYAQNQMLTFAQLATSSAVLQPVIDDLGLDHSVQSLKRSVVVTIPQNTLVLKIRVSAQSGQEAADLANAIADSLTTVVHSVSPKPTTGESPNIDASLVDTAVAPRYQASPDKTKDTVLGGVAGLIVGVLLALLAALLDRRVRDRDTLRRLTAVPLLATVPRVPGHGPVPLIAQAPPPFQEEFRRLGPALRHAGAAGVGSVGGGVAGGAPHRLLVTSPTTGAGTTTVAVNLALALSDLGVPVLLVDANLRAPGVAPALDLDGSRGLTTVLEGTAPIDRVEQVPHGTHLDVLTSGALPQDPGATLASQELHDLLTEAAAHHDVVIIDTPAVLDVADAALLAAHADSVLVVVDHARTRRADLTQALTTLDTAGGVVVGTVLNRQGTTRRRRRVSRVNRRAAVTQRS